jgi:hypothetical protein
MEVAQAAWDSGIVVFDATIDADCHNYHAATYSLLLSEHCVVLSRIYLPMNFQGHLEPIAPPYSGIGRIVRCCRSFASG